MLRSCYSTQMRFYRDDDRAVTVRWYFVDDAPFIPHPTPFNSRNWELDQLGWDGLGEVYDAPRVWRDGSKVGNADWRNKHLCGTPDQWLNGQPLPPAVPVRLNMFGTPLCCESPPFAAMKGAAGLGLGLIGGQAFRPPPLVPSCTYVTHPPYTVWLDARTVTSGACNCTSLRRWIPLSFVERCKWRSGPVWLCGATLPYRWELTFFSGGPQLVLAQDTTGVDAGLYLGDFDWDGLSPYVLHNVVLPAPFDLCTWPGTVTIYPGKPHVGSIGFAAGAKGGGWPVDLHEAIGVAYGVSGKTSLAAVQLGSVGFGMGAETSLWPSPPAAQQAGIGFGASGTVSQTTNLPTNGGFAYGAGAEGW